MNGGKLQLIFQGRVEEMVWGRDSLLKDLGKRDTHLISVCDCGRGHLWICVGCYPFFPRVGCCKLGEGSRGILHGM